ncbi:MAG: hypothetical protein AAFW70_14175 [Cyanobacteria bacterium J06635_10]
MPFPITHKFWLSKLNATLAEINLQSEKLNEIQSATVLSPVLLAHPGKIPGDSIGETT